jgi:hypothetical protein
VSEVSELFKLSTSLDGESQKIPESGNNVTPKATTLFESRRRQHELSSGNIFCECSNAS